MKNMREYISYKHCIINAESDQEDVDTELFNFIDSKPLFLSWIPENSLHWLVSFLEILVVS